MDGEGKGEKEKKREMERKLEREREREVKRLFNSCYCSLLTVGPAGMKLNCSHNVTLSPFR